MSTLRVDNLRGVTNEALVPLSELRQRWINSYYASYNSGSWQPSTAYGWAPGLFYDYTPASASSRIRTTCNFSYSHASGHAISHCIFYANGVEQGRHSIAGQSPEHRHAYIWDFASWGTSAGRIGYQIRSYGGSNQPRFHGTHHWDGTGSNQNAMAEIIIEEYFPIP